MNISNSQVNRLRHFVRAGLRSLFRPEPQTAVEWADANYYLPKESAYQEGRWETLPFQRAIMNAMGSDYIREVNVVKSARVGYSKMLLGVYAYFIEHKQRNTLIWLPTDGDAENFMKTHVEPTIRDIPSLLALAPWYGKKHRDNTLTMKRFTNGRGFWCLGGKAAKNYREKSVDVAGYDELAAFDEDIEQEGSPTFLGDKRIEGSVWPKSIRGSTPKVRGTCQIERAASESPHFMRFHVACPHCAEKVYLSQIPGLVNMALYVSPIVSGEVIRSRGGSTSEFTPGYVKPKHEVNPQMTLRRLPDEDPQNLADPAYRRRRIILQNMRDEELAIAQVEEMQAVSAVLKGKYTMTGEAFDPVEVDMGRSVANNITQSGGTEWSKRDKSTYDPTDDIEAYALNASGVVNIIVFDPKGWALFRSFKAVKEKLDTRRGSHSELETAVKDLGEAVSYKGMYGDTAIVVYSGQYVENDVKKNFLPDNTMVLGNTQARGLRTYGCIQDADAQREGINASARYPKNWVTTGDPAREFTMIQSAPLMLLADPDAFVSVQLA
ncbi:major capsid protein [Escherichia coli]